MDDDDDPVLLMDVRDRCCDWGWGGDFLRPSEKLDDDDDDGSFSDLDLDDLEDLPSLNFFIRTRIH